MSAQTPGGDPRFGPTEGFGTAYLVAPVSPSHTAVRPRLGAPRWLVPTVIGLIAVLVLAMVGVYWVEGQKHKADLNMFKHTTLAVPDSFAGLARGVGPGVQSVEARVNLSLASSGALQPVAADYIDADGNSYALVSAGKRVTAPNDTEGVALAAVDRFATGIGTGGAGAPITAVEYPAGQLGGVLRCGATDIGGIAATFCVAVDQGAIVQMVIANGDVKSAATTARGLREAVVKRTA